MQYAIRFNAVDFADRNQKWGYRYEEDNPGAGGYIDHPRGIVLLSGFFGGGPGHRIDFARSRAVALIHEAIHLQGIRDTDFDRDRDEGSRKINTFIIQSCINKAWGWGHASEGNCQYPDEFSYASENSFLQLKQHRTDPQLANAP